MARLFIGPREINFIEDIVKEVIKDIIGQKIYYYPISEIKTKVHTVYKESPEKIFDDPISIDCLVQAYSSETKSDIFGGENVIGIEAFIQTRDLIDKSIEISLGDFFSYGDVMFEIAKVERLLDLYGQTEHENGIKLVGKKSRKDVFQARLFGPTSAKFTDPDAVQTVFEQQRGASSNSFGPTGDVRALQNEDVLGAPLTGPKQISPAGDQPGVGSAFYDED